jgi:hypothetical protein
MEIQSRLVIIIGLRVLLTCLKVNKSFDILTGVLRVLSHSLQTTDGIVQHLEVPNSTAYNNLFILFDTQSLNNLRINLQERFEKVHSVSSTS